MDTPSSTTPGQTPEYIPVKEAMRELGGISRSSFYGLRERDGFPSPRYVGTRPVWSRSELRAWVSAQTAPVAAQTAPQAA